MEGHFLPVNVISSGLEPTEHFQFSTHPILFGPSKNPSNMKGHHLA